MPIAVDLDNVIAGTDSKIRHIILSLCGIPLLQSDIQSWEYADALIAKGVDVTSAKAIIKQTFERFHEVECTNVEPIDGAIPTILNLSEAGIEFVVVTGRPKTTRCEELTKEWLRKCSIPDSWLIMQERKAEFSSNWSILIDDAPHHANEVAAAGTRVLLFDYPWNRSTYHALIRRVSSWCEIKSCVLELRMTQ